MPPSPSAPLYHAVATTLAFPFSIAASTATIESRQVGRHDLAWNCESVSAVSIPVQNKAGVKQAGGEGH